MRQVTVWGLSVSSGSGAGYCCMPREGRQGGGWLVRGMVTRRRGRPGRVAVHMASGGRKEGVEGARGRLSLAESHAEG